MVVLPPMGAGPPSRSSWGRDSWTRRRPISSVWPSAWTMSAWERRRFSWCSRERRRPTGDPTGFSSCPWPAWERGPFVSPLPPALLPQEPPMPAARHITSAFIDWGALEGDDYVRAIPALATMGELRLHDPRHLLRGRERQRQVDPARSHRGGLRLQRRGRHPQLQVQHLPRRRRGSPAPCTSPAAWSARARGTSSGPRASSTWPPRPRATGGPTAPPPARRAAQTVPRRELPLVLPGL